MKILCFFLLLQIFAARLFEINPSSKKVRKLARKVARRLFLEDLNLTTGNYQIDELDNTHTNFYQMEGHNRRSSQMRQVGTWFSDLDNVIDDYRDQLSKKLDQFSTQLQQPRIPTRQMERGSSTKGSLSIAEPIGSM